MLANDDGFTIGQLYGKVDSMSRELGQMREDIQAMREAVEGLKIWKAQVVGMSAAVSCIVSAVFYCVALFIHR